MKKNRLSKIIAWHSSYARRKAEVLIEEGKVTVNGKIETTPQFMVHPEHDNILVEGKPLARHVKKRTFIVNKPKGYVCSHVLQPGQKSVFSLIPPESGKWLFVGRLDKDSEGLIILTNDGTLSHEVIHPSNGHTKEYLAKVNKDLGHEDLVRLSKRVCVEGRWVKPVRVKKVRKNSVLITIREGKKHEVRKMVEYIEAKVLMLKRVRIGNLHLGSLETGAFREVKSVELKKMLDSKVEKKSQVSYNGQK